MRAVLGAGVAMLVLASSCRGQREGPGQTEAQRQQQAWQRWIEVLDDPQHRFHDNAPWRLSSPTEFPYVTDRSQAVGPLIRHLRDADPRFRSYVAAALGQIADPRATKPLLHALSDELPQVRAAAVKALGQMRMAPRKEVAPAILAALKDGAPEVRAAACLAMAALREGSGREKIVKCLEDDEWCVRQAAAEALASLGADASAGPFLVEMLGDEQPQVRTAAAKALGATWNYPPAVEALDKASKDHEAGVRMTAVQGLGELARKDMDGGLSAVLTALEDDLPLVQQAAVEAAAKFGAKAVEPLVAHLRQECPLHPTPQVRALAEIVDPAATAALLDLARHGTSQVRLAALRALAFRGNRQAADTVTPVAAMLADENLDIRTAVVHALGCIAGHGNQGDMQAVDGLMGLLAKDPEPGVRAACAVALGAFQQRIQRYTYIPPVLVPANPILDKIAHALGAALKDEAASVRLAVLETMDAAGLYIHLPEDEEVPVLSGLLEDDDLAVRLAAARALVRMQSMNPFAWTEAIRKALESNDWRVRAEVVEWLGRLYPRPDVLKRATDPAEHPQVRIAALRGLEAWPREQASQILRYPSYRDGQEQLWKTLMSVWQDTGNPIEVRLAALKAAGAVSPVIPMPARSGSMPGLPIESDD
jgi:HEAT repeat protein